LYQPPNAPRGYWDTMVKRMKAVFKAPVADEDMPAIVDYLVKTYGAEQPK
jgi:sulfite dehydrogenase (cytochrome) subunit B